MAEGIRIEFSISMQILFVILLSLILIFIQKKNKVNNNFIMYFVSISFCLYLVKILDIAFFPFDINFTEEAKRFSQLTEKNLNLIPFKSIINNVGSGVSWKQNGGNFILLLPLGAYLPLLIRKKLSFKKITLLGFLFSLSIELGQYVMNFILGYRYRVVDIDDILLNTSGCILGYTIIRIFWLVFERKHGIQSESVTKSE